MPPDEEQRKDAELKHEKNTFECELPSITHLQFLALDSLARSSSALAAQDLKIEIMRFEPNYDGPKFYQLMKRLSSSGLIEINSQSIDVAGSQVTRTFYAATSLGISARNSTIAFYVDRAFWNKQDRPS